VIDKSKGKIESVKDGTLIIGDQVKMLQKAITSRQSRILTVFGVCSNKFELGNVNSLVQKIKQIIDCLN